MRVLLDREPEDFDAVPREAARREPVERLAVERLLVRDPLERPLLRDDPELAVDDPAFALERLDARPGAFWVMAARSLSKSLSA